MFGLTENDKGLLKGLDTGHINPAVPHPPLQVSRGVHRGLVCGGLSFCPGSFTRHLGGPRGNAALVRSVSCATFHAEAESRAGARASPGAPASRQTDCVPFVPISPPDTCVIALICPDSIQPGVPLDFKCQTSVIQGLAQAD